MADETLRCVMNDEFLILPHKQVHKHVLKKAKDYSKYLHGMLKIDSMFGESFRHVPPNARL